MSPKQQAALICIVVQKKTGHAAITSHVYQMMDDVDTKILALTALKLFLLEEESRRRNIRRKVRCTKWVKL